MSGQLTQQRWPVNVPAQVIEVMVFAALVFEVKESLPSADGFAGIRVHFNVRDRLKAGTGEPLGEPPGSGKKVNESERLGGHKQRVEAKT